MEARNLECGREAFDGRGEHFYLTERIHEMVSLKSIHLQTRQLNYMTMNIKQ